MLEQGDAAFGADPFDQGLAAPGHDDVNVVGHAQHLADGGTVRRRHQLDRRRWQAAGRQALGQPIHDRPRRVVALGTAAQDGGVAGLQAQAAGVGGDVGARFVDHPDNAEGHPNAADVKAVRTVPGGHLVAHGVIQIGDRLEPRRDAVEAPGIEFQAGRAWRR